MCHAHALRPPAQNHPLSTCRGGLAPAQPPARCPSAQPWRLCRGGLCRPLRTCQAGQLCPLHPACSPVCAGSCGGAVASLGSGPAPCSSTGSRSRLRDAGLTGWCCCGGAGAATPHGWCTESWAGTGTHRPSEGGVAALCPCWLSCRLSCMVCRRAGAVLVQLPGDTRPRGPGCSGQGRAGAASEAAVRGPSPLALQGEGRGASALQSSWPRTRRK